MKAFALALLVSPLVAAQPVWKQDGNRSVELGGEGGKIVRFVLDAAPRDPHFEVLATRDGRNTVWLSPPDHIWHYGLWFSWKMINGVNFWETDKEFRQQGRNEIHDPLIEIDPDGVTATIRYRELAHPDPEGPAVLEDKVAMVVTRPQEDAGVKVEWRITTSALADVVLDRTPPPGEPGGRGWGGYGGFSWRGAKDFKAVTFLGSEGRRDEALHRQHAEWVNVSGSIDGKPAGLLIINDPRNPRHPPSWYVTGQPDLPFWYANPALLQEKPLKLKKGESLTHVYQVIVHDGSWNAERCGRKAGGDGAGEK